MIFDVDFFKQYNDNYGHAAGDQILKDVSQAILNSYRRRGDYTFRLGGEEFGVICNITTTQDAEMLANLTRQAIEKLNLTHNHSPLGQITISCGVYVGQGSDIPQDEKEVYIAADKALYEAKENGRNRVSVYGSSDDIILT